MAPPVLPSTMAVPLPEIRLPMIATSVVLLPGLFPGARIPMLIAVFNAAVPVTSGPIKLPWIRVPSFTPPKGSIRTPPCWSPDRRFLSAGADPPMTMLLPNSILTAKPLVPGMAIVPAGFVPMKLPAIVTFPPAALTVIASPFVRLITNPRIVVPPALTTSPAGEFNSMRRTVFNAAGNVFVFALAPGCV